MNFASTGNLVFERNDAESVPEFRARVREAVGGMGGGVLAWGAPDSLEWVDAEPEIVTVRGGLEERGYENFAQFGDTLIEREAGESLEGFRARAREAVIAAGAGFVSFGGLKPMPMDD